MKVITIKQPWAEMIVLGIKDIENRTWRTNFRGRILVHAAKTIVPYSEIINYYPLPAARNAIREIQNQSPTCITSAIIGSVEIADCVRNHPSEWAEEGVWNWVLSNPIKYDKPITSINGKLSIWEHDLFQYKDQPYAYMEYVTSLSKVDERPKGDWYFKMKNELMSLTKDEFIDRTVEIVREMPFMANMLDMQYFRDGKGCTVAQIWAAPGVSHFLAAEELATFTARINEAISKP